MISLHPPIGSQYPMKLYSHWLREFNPPCFSKDYIKVSLSKSWSLLRKTADQKNPHTTGSHLSLTTLYLDFKSKQPLGDLFKLQLLGINWIEQNTRDSLPVNVHFPSALHPDSTSTRRTVH